MMRAVNYATDGWFKKGAPLEIKRAALSLKNASMRTTEFKPPLSQKTVNINNMYDMMIEKIPQNDTAALSVLTTQGDVMCFVNEYTIFKNEETSDHRYIRPSELVPIHKTGVDAAYARNHLAHALIGNPDRYYPDAETPPSDEDLYIMNEAVELTMAVLTDPLLDTEHEAKQDAIKTMSHILIIQGNKSDEVAQYAEIIEYGYTESHDFSQDAESSFASNKEDIMKYLSGANEYILGLMKTSDFSDVANAVITHKNQKLQAA